MIPENEPSCCARPLVAQLLGGLGNQMFQYAAARALSLKQNRQLLIDTSVLEDHSEGTHLVNRNYELDCFSLETQRARRLTGSKQGDPLVSVSFSD